MKENIFEIKNAYIDYALINKTSRVFIRTQITSTKKKNTLYKQFYFILVH